MTEKPPEVYDLSLSRSFPFVGIEKGHESRQWLFAFTVVFNVLFVTAVYFAVESHGTEVAAIALLGVLSGWYACRVVVYDRLYGEE